MRPTLLAVLIGVTLAACARADEGMWLYNAPPLKILKDKYHFEPDAKWLEHLQKSSVRFGQGGSASFVSPDGLVMTNHHVGRDALTKLSTKDRALAHDFRHAECPKAEHAAVSRCASRWTETIQSASLNR